MTDLGLPRAAGPRVSRAAVPPAAGPRRQALRARELRRVASSTRRGGLFEALGPLATEALLSNAVRRAEPAKAQIVHEGSVSDAVVVLLAGRVKLVAVLGGREVVLDVRGPGEVVSDLSAIGGTPSAFGAAALEPVEVAVLRGRELGAIAAERPEAALGLARALAAELREERQRRAQFAAADTGARVCAVLADLARSHGRAGRSGIEVDLPLTQEELAGLAAASHKAATTALRRLRELGWIETRRRRITIRDLDAVRRAAP